MAAAMARVNFFARDDVESLPNYKLLQAGLAAAGLRREIAVAKLMRGARADALELLQFLHARLRGAAPPPHVAMLADVNAARPLCYVHACRHPWRHWPGP